MHTNVSSHIPLRVRAALTPNDSQPDAKYVHKSRLRYANHSLTATDYAITHKLTPFISMQNHYSLIYREEEREMFPTLKVSLPKLRL